MDRGLTYLEYISKRFASDERSTDEYSADELCDLALCCLYGIGMEEAPARAAELLQIAARTECARAHGLLSEFYACGIGVKINPHLAVNHARIAAEKNDAYGLMCMGLFYLEGNTVAKDEARAFELIKNSAEMNCTAAIANLGRMYLTGTGCKKDYALALQNLKRAAKRNDPAAMYFLGVMYALGEGVAKDREAAKLWLIRCIAMESDNTDKAKEVLDRVIAEIREEASRSLTNRFFGFTPCGNPAYDPHLHDFFYDGLKELVRDDPEVDGTEQDYPGEDEYSLYCRSVIIRRDAFGKGTYTLDEFKVKIREAAALLERSSEMGLGIASLAYGALYKFYGSDLGEKNYTAAEANQFLFDKIKLSAEQGCARGHYSYAYLLDTGLGVAKNRDEALYHYYLSYRGRYVDGMSVWHNFSDSDKERTVAAVSERLLEELIRVGNADTLISCARKMMSSGTRRDCEAALRLLTRAHALGSTEAAYLTAECYYLLGNPSSAVGYLIDAAREGHIAAGYELAHLVVHSISPEGAKIKLTSTSLDGKYLSDSKVVTFLERAYESGITDAAYDLGIHLRDKKLAKQALHWLGIALGHGKRDAAYHIGMIYYLDLSEPGNARQYFETVADENADAAFQLAEMIRYNEKDYTRAKFYYDEAAKLLADAGKGDGYLAGVIKNRLDHFRAHECPSCHAYFSAVEKHSLFGKKMVCSVCGKGLKQ